MMYCNSNNLSYKILEFYNCHQRQKLFTDIYIFFECLLYIFFTGVKSFSTFELTPAEKEKNLWAS